MSVSPMTDRLFRARQLSVGLVLPLRAGTTQEVDFLEQLELAVLAEELGFSAIWVRDVPLNGPWYPEDFGHPDPWAMLAAIAARTSRIALGTAAIVLPLRHPLHIAKAAISLDHLSGGRFILGLGSGDRPKELAAFGLAEADVKARYREHWAQLAAALERPPRVEFGSGEAGSGEAGSGEGGSGEAGPGGSGEIFELRPAAQRDIPMIAIGSGGQTLQWIARNAAGWATYHRPPARQRDRHALWRRAAEGVVPGQFRSFSVALALELDEDPQAPPHEIDLGYRIGAERLPGLFQSLRQGGLHHVMLNLAPSGRAVAGQLARIAESLPQAEGSQLAGGHGQ